MSKTIPTSIKKMSLSYCQCPNGDMHTGQLMNLVCVDSVCTKRGLICPVCRMNNHESHQILPLKIFLEEIKQLFMKNENNDDSLNNLSDYLRSLQNSRKELINILKVAAEEIAREFKTIEENIQANYIAIRRNILAQSSISTKLPTFVQSLSKNSSKDAFALQQQFQKYSELIKFENNVMNVCDKSKKLVEDYSKVPPRVESFLKEQVKQIQKSFKQSVLGKGPTQFAKKDSVLVQQYPFSEDTYSFSEEGKSYEVYLKNNGKTAYMGDTIENQGIVYLEGGDESSLKRKVAFRINSSSSGSIMLGVGNYELDKEVGFFFNSPIKNRHFGISVTGQKIYYDGESDDGSDSSLDPVKMNLDYDGAQVTAYLHLDSKSLCFIVKQNGDDGCIKKGVNLDVEGLDLNKLKFFVVLAENDEVSIIDV